MSAAGICPRCGQVVALWHPKPECDAYYDRAYGAAQDSRPAATSTPKSESALSASPGDEGFAGRGCSQDGGGSGLTPERQMILRAWEAGWDAHEAFVRTSSPAMDVARRGWQQIAGDVQRDVIASIRDRVDLVLDSWDKVHSERVDEAAYPDVTRRERSHAQATRDALDVLCTATADVVYGLQSPGGSPSGAAPKSQAGGTSQVAPDEGTDTAAAAVGTDDSTATTEGGAERSEPRSPVGTCSNCGRSHACWGEVSQ